MRTLVPMPVSESMVTPPPALVMMPCTAASPRPVPSLGGLVLKKGSKAWGMTSGSMTQPVSLTVSTAHRSGLALGQVTPRTSLRSAVPVVKVRTPPWGIASRALTARLSSTCSICPRSAMTVGR